MPELKPIEPKTPRWEPTPDAHNIVVPGLDTTAPVYDQIEQMEQLITIKLQNIDANFSKIQHVMANKILPAVKRYAVGTQPVREAAKFWTTFYEQAAQIRIPTYDDYGATPAQEDETEQSESQTVPTEPSSHSDNDSEASTPHANRTFNPDGTSSEVSFAPQAAISSTPATSRARRHNAHDSFASEGFDPTPSWTASIESPLMQLNRDIQSLADDHSNLPSTSAFHRSAAYDESQDATQRTILPASQPHEPSTVRASKGKSREGPQPLLQDVLRRNANTSTATTNSSVHSRMTSPLRFKPKTPVLKSLNPYLPPDTDPSDWKGVVDLSDPASTTPRRTPAGLPTSSIKLSGFKFSSTASSNAAALARVRTKTPPPSKDDSSDEDFGMSPPVMTDYARLPKLGRTPKKEAAERIMQNLLDVERRGVFAPAGASSKRAPAGQTKSGVESSMSTIPTPPSMTRYARPSYVPPSTSEMSGSVVDASLDSIMRRVGLSVPGHSGKPVAAPASASSRDTSGVPVFSSLSSVSSIPSFRSATSAASLSQPPPPPPEPVQTPQPPQYDYYDEDEVIGQGGVGDPDDSSDSLDYEEANNSANPSAAFLFAAQRASYDDDDDSFDSSMGDDDDPDGDTSGVVPIHPFLAAAQMPEDGDGFDDDDSFDDGAYGPDGEEETIFGVPPAQRLQQQAQQAGQFRMLGEDLLQDTIGIGSQMAMAGRVEESPTPWGPPNAREG
ncbi:hypothetical protein C8Q70DRAFT_1003003 [Cubamyces menziesii]|nr:hypothetical protein C8Q70DRAFT_1003003 [Cubamyces menziesii]